jgi:Asp-tRNA(Asn)/Glu-tRNA(Gln) amidotransferase A subunit family amidase
VREKTRRLHHNLAGVAGGFITLSATGAAPLAVTLPCLSVEALPLGIQLMGFKDKDEILFSHAQWAANILLFPD